MGLKMSEKESLARESVVLYARGVKVPRLIDVLL